MTIKHESLSNHLLIAMPYMDDPFFQSSVVYIHEHNAKGAMGVVINKPLSLQLADIFDEMSIKLPKNFRTAHYPVLSGGLIDPQKGFVLFESPVEGAAALQISTSRDVLELIAQKKGPKRSLICLGYSSWGPHQLEKELKENLWLYAPFNADVVFEYPLSERWHRSFRLLGIEPQQITIQEGHA